MGSTTRRSAVLLLKDLTKVCGCTVPHPMAPIPLMGAVSPGQEVLCLTVIPFPVGVSVPTCSSSGPAVPGCPTW